ncbi:MAG TPA: dihydroneopterin aldolase [Nevskiaceae bacterium]
MTDWIALEGLVVAARVGVYDWERTAPRPLVLDIRLMVDLRTAGASDALEDTVDYQAAADTATAVGVERHYALIEAYAERLAGALFARFPCTALALTVRKPGAVAGTRSLGIHIERRRDDRAASGRDHEGVGGAASR